MNYQLSISTNQLNMKALQLLLLSIILSAVLMVSCGDDDGDTIAGTYRLTAFSQSNCADPLENYNLDLSADDGCTTLLGEEICGDGTLTLTESGGFSYNLTLTALGQSFTSSGNGSYTVDGNQITICDGEDCETSSFALGSGQITISFSESGDPCVLSLTGEKI